MADVQGLGEEWERNGEIRARMRESTTLCIRPDGHKWCEATRPNCVNNIHVLIPILHRMRECDDWKLPCLEALKAQVAVCHNRLGLKIKEADIYTSAIEMKKMTSFIKRRTRRMECTKDWLFVLVYMVKKNHIRWVKQIAQHDASQPFWGLYMMVTWSMYLY